MVFKAGSTEDRGLAFAPHGLHPLLHSHSRSWFAEKRTPAPNSCLGAGKPWSGFAGKARPRQVTEGKRADLVRLRFPAGMEDRRYRFAGVHNAAELTPSGIVAPGQAEHLPTCKLTRSPQCMGVRRPPAQNERALDVPSRVCKFGTRLLALRLPGCTGVWKTHRGHINH